MFLKKESCKSTHLAPINHVGVEVKPELVDEVIDIVNRESAIPAAIEVHRERAKTVLHCLQNQVAAVNTATYPDHAVVGLTFTCSFHLVEELLEFTETLSAIGCFDNGLAWFF